MDGIDPHIRSLKHGANMSRRAFAVTGLVTGFTLATGPLNAQSVITTDAQGLTAGEVHIPAADRQLAAYRAKPAVGARFTTILVVHEAFGVHEHIKDVCRRLAKLGYQAIAPDLFARQGDAAQLTDIQQVIALLARVPDAQVMGDLDATARWAAGDGGDPQRLGITGFCWGGRVVWMYAAHNANVKAGVAWYGPLNFRPDDQLRPRQPRDVAAQIRGAVLGLYSAVDNGIPQDQVEAMRAALRAANNPSEFVIYPDAPHGFHSDYRPTYRAEAARDGWNRLQAWFRQHGVAPSS